MPSWLRMSCRLAAWLLCLLLMACTSTTFLEPFDTNAQRIGQIKVECDETACTGTGTSGETFRGTWARDYDTGGGENALVNDKYTWLFGGNNSNNAPAKIRISLTGDRGTHIECDRIDDNWNSGSCRADDGAAYWRVRNFPEFSTPAAAPATAAPADASSQ